MQVELSHALEDMFGAFLMSRGVGGEDEEVVHIDDEPFFRDHVTEGVVHEPLKGGRGVGEVKEHDGGFKEAFVGDKGSLPLVSVLDSNIVVSPSDIKFGEYFGIFELINEVRDQREGISISDSVFIEVSIVLTGAESSILFLYEEEGGGLGGV